MVYITHHFQKFNVSKNRKTCPNCNQVFKKIDLYNSYLITCDQETFDDDQFVPSFMLSESILKAQPHEDEIMENTEINSDQVLPNEEIILEFTQGSTPTRPHISKSNEREWGVLKQTQRKAPNLESIIQNLSSLVKKGVIKNVADKNSETVGEILAYTNAASIYEARMCQALLKELKLLHSSKKYRIFHEKLEHTLALLPHSCHTLF